MMLAIFLFQETSETSSDRNINQSFERFFKYQSLVKSTKKKTPPHLQGGIL